MYIININKQKGVYKKMKKKLLNILACLSIILIGAFALVGCGDDPDTNIYVSTEAQLTTAVANSNNNKIVLKNDIELTEQLVVTKKLTLDLNGKELSNATDIWNDTDGIDTWSLISVQDNGELTLTGNGTLNAKENDCYAVDARDNAKVTIKNGTLTGNVSAVYVIDNATVTIEGGTYNIKQLSIYSDYRYLLNALDRDNQDATIIVKGGTFTQYDPSHSNSENPEMNFVANGYEAVESSGNYVVSKIAD